MPQALSTMAHKVTLPSNWTVEEGDYSLGNLFHPCAVMIPCKDDLGIKLHKVSLEMGVAIVGFCRTANIGIEKVICNVLANPNIRYLVVAGYESKGHLSGEAMIKLWRFGIDDETRRILHCDAPTAYVLNLPLEAIDRFRKQVVVLDLLIDSKSCGNKLNEVTIGSMNFKAPVAKLGDEVIISKVCECHADEALKLVIHSCIQEPDNKIIAVIKGIKYELCDMGAFDERPHIISIAKRVRESHYVDTLSEDYTYIIAENFAEGYGIVRNLIEKYGRRVWSQYGWTKELLNVVITYVNPLSDEIPKEYPLASRQYIDEYCEALIKGREIKGYTYTYGERLRRYGSEIEKFIGVKPPKVVDQLEGVVQKLVKSALTRQAVIIFYDPLTDLDLNKEPPCLTHCHMMIRNGKLHMSAYIRSHDFENAHIHNMFALARIMKYVVNRLKDENGDEFGDLNVGTLTVMIGSCHIYEK